MYQDKTLKCKDCGNDFVFTAGEQEFYASKGFENKPSRCKECRAAKKHPVRYLSVMPGHTAADTSAWPARARLKTGVLDKQMLTALGLCWGQHAEAMGGLDMAAKLLSACSGDPVTVDDLRQSAMALNRALNQ